MATNNATNTSNPITVPQGGTGDTSLTAYSVLCGGTTSTSSVQSVSGSGSAGQILTSNGASALPTWQAAPGGGGSMTLLQTLTASSSASLAFTSTYITSTYNAYYIIIDNIKPSTTATFELDYSENNGSTYTSTNYSSSCYSGSFTTPATSTSNVLLSASITGSTAYSGTISIQNLTSGNSYTSLQGSCTPIILNFASYANSGNPINNIRFKFSTGNIVSGKISLYGITQ